LDWLALHWEGLFLKPEESDFVSPSPHHLTDYDPGLARFGGTAAHPAAVLSVINVLAASALHRKGDLCL